MAAVTGLDPLPTGADTLKKYAPYFEEKSSEELSMSNFFQLLMSEMTNQDPMEPMSNTEFVSQLATFTSLQAQQESLYYSNANYAQSLVGKEVLIATTADDGKSMEQAEGVITSMRAKGKDFYVTVNGKEYPLKSVAKVTDGGTKSSLSQDEAYAAQLIGYQVSVATITASGDLYQDTGIVSHVEVQDGVVMVVVNGYAFRLADIIKVELPDFADNPTDTGDTTDGGDVDGTDSTDGVDGADGGDDTGTGTDTGGTDSGTDATGGVGDVIPDNDPSDVPEFTPTP